jgi:hypothetical protein
VDSRAYNGVLRFCNASDRREAAKFLEGLPEGVLGELSVELEVAGEAQRYDLGTHRAYSFEKSGAGFTCWIWDDVRNYDEAGELLGAVVECDGPLTAELAAQLYTRATQRDVLVAMPPQPDAD